MKTVVGLIGAGAFTQYALESYRRYTSGIEFRANTDLKKEVAEQLAETFNIPITYATVDELLADKEITVVLILTPPNTHFELAKKALQAGKHVLVEKPIAFTVEQAAELIHLADKHNLKMTANLVLRYHPFHQKIRSIVQNNEYGRLENITTTAALAEYPKDHWYWNPKISGGFFLNTFCHFIDLYDFIVGQSPKKLSATGNQEQGFIVTSLFTDQQTASLAVNLHVSNDQEMVQAVYVFEKAIITTTGWLPETMTITLPDGQKLEEKSSEKNELYQQILAQILEELIDRINNPTHSGLINHQTLYQAVVEPLEASQN